MDRHWTQETLPNSKSAAPTTLKVILNILQTNSIVTHCFSKPFLKLNDGLSWMMSCSNIVEHFLFLREVMFREVALYTLELGWRGNWVYAWLTQFTTSSGIYVHYLESKNEVVIKHFALIFIQLLVISKCIIQKPVFLTCNPVDCSLEWWYLEGKHHFHQQMLSECSVSKCQYSNCCRVLHSVKIFKLLLKTAGKSWVIGNRLKAMVTRGILDHYCYLCFRSFS